MAKKNGVVEPEVVVETVKEESVVITQEDNSELLAELQSLRNEIVALQTENAELLNGKEELSSEILSLNQTILELNDKINSNVANVESVDSSIEYKFPINSWVSVPNKYQNMRFLVKRHSGVSGGEAIYSLYQYEHEIELYNVHESELIVARNNFN